MSWLDDITPDFGNPNTGALFGALGGLAQAAQPIRGYNGMGVKGMSPLVAALGAIGDLAGGAQQGAQDAQKYNYTKNAATATDLANQLATQTNPLNAQQLAQNVAFQGQAMPMDLLAKQVALEQAQRMNPLQVQGQQIGNASGALDLQNKQFMQPYIQGNMSALYGAPAPGSLAGGIPPMPPSALAAPNPQGPIPAPPVPGQIPNQPDPQTVNALQQYRQANGMATPPIDNQRATMGLPVGVGSALPVGSPMNTPANSPLQQTQGMPQLTAAMPTRDTRLVRADLADAVGNKNMADGLRFDYQHDPSVIQNESVTKKEAEDRATNLAEAEKAYSVTNANFPNVMQRMNAMLADNQQSNFGPYNDKEGDGVAPFISKALDNKTAAANTNLKQVAAQGLLGELGPALTQAGVKGNKFLENIANNSSNLDLTDSKGARENAINQLTTAYLQNMIAARQQMINNGGMPAPLPTTAATEAVKRNVINPSDVTNYLAPGTRIPIRDPKGNAGTIDVAHLPGLLRDGGKLQ